MHDYAQGQWSNFAKESKFDVLVHDNEKKTDHVTSKEPFNSIMNDNLPSKSPKKSKPKEKNPHTLDQNPFHM